VKTEAEREHAHQPGVLFAAGLITGEALMGIVIAIPIVVSGRGDVLALPAQWQFGQALGLVLVAAVAWFLFRASTRPRPG
jgi:membrane protein implicated in regulation of membrane protease activity